MRISHLLHELVVLNAEARPETEAVKDQSETVSYARLVDLISSFAAGLMDFDLRRGERVALYLDKRVEFVAGAFGTTAAGGAFVPLNPLLKPDQVGYILRD